MPGQPQYPPILFVDVNGLEVNAQTGFWSPTNIVASNEPFALGARFQGSGFVWTWLKNWNQQYQVSYFAEAIGNSANDQALGSRVNALTASNTYGPPDTDYNVAAGTLPVGIYRIACVLTFPGAPGLTGYFESLIMEVYQA